MRYSERLPWSFSSNSFSRLLETRRQAGHALLDLTISNPTQALSSYPHSEIAQAYGSLAALPYRPDPLGRLQARLAVASYYERRGIHIAPERIALTASTSEAYSILFKLLCNPADEILVPAPSYPLFEYLAKLECVRAVSYKLSYDGSWFLDVEDLRRQITPRTRAIVLVNPNNPTGSYLKSREAQALISFANENRLAVIADEVFADYSISKATNRIDTFVGCDPMVSFSLNGLSKVAGMPQMKLGWIVSNGPDAEVQAVRHRLELILDTYLSVGAPVQEVLPVLFDIGERIQKTLKDRLLLNWNTANQILENSPAHCLCAEGGWSAIVQLPRTHSEDIWITRLLVEKGVVVQPGYFFDMPVEAYVIVSLITPPEEFGEGMRRLRQLISEM